MSNKEFFTDELQQCEEKFLSRQEQYGDSWKHMPLWKLRNRLHEEISEWEDGNEAEEPGELVDIINISLMLLKRCKNAE